MFTTALNWPLTSTRYRRPMKTSHAQWLAILAGALTAPFALFLALHADGLADQTAAGWAMIISLFATPMVAIFLTITVLMARWLTRLTKLPTLIGYPLWNTLCPLLLIGLGAMVIDADFIIGQVRDADLSDQLTFSRFALFAALPGFVAGVAMFAEHHDLRPNALPA